MRDNLLTGEREGNGTGEEPNRRPQETFVLYKSFNTPWSIVYVVSLIVTTAGFTDGDTGKQPTQQASGGEAEIWFHEDCFCWVPGVYLVGSRYYTPVYTVQPP
jgi:hypothetical protein